eukprot:371532-Karenia_brevis.AAC.1
MDSAGQSQHQRTPNLDLDASSPDCSRSSEARNLHPHHCSTCTTWDSENNRRSLVHRHSQGSMQQATAQGPVEAAPK